MASDSAATVSAGRAKYQELKVYLANPRGFCAGVERAIDIVERALLKFGAPVYVRHEIVHNKRVVEELREKGAVFVEELDEVPTGAVTIFSAHGVSRVVENDAQNRKLQVIDATCPLVSKVHIEGRRYSAKGYDVVLVGHRGHAEVEGTIGQIPGEVHVVACVEDVALLTVSDPAKVAYVTQTTLSVTDTREIIDALKARFPKVVGPDTNDICYATQNRQNAVREMLNEIDLLIVVGAANSSNSNRLREIGAEAGVPSYLIGHASALNPHWLKGVETIGITAGASAPESIVQETIEQLSTLRRTCVIGRKGIKEDIQFKLPPSVARL
ncbi:MAG: 4-hydroxy-3-methylbut-2-enyl diphosphate reductase [Pseudomonadota bacterium]